MKKGHGTCQQCTFNSPDWEEVNKHSTETGHTIWWVSEEDMVRMAAEQKALEQIF